MQNLVLKSSTGLLLAISLYASAYCQTTITPSPSATPASGGSPVQLFPSAEVTTSFLQGGTLAQGSNYKVMTALRTKGGNVEVHRKFTDVFYVVEGKATIVVGGRVLGESASDADEPRGTSIEGGESRQLLPGDVIVIPAGIPHWINAVEGSFRYFVVKVQTPEP